MDAAHGRDIVSGNAAGPGGGYAGLGDDGDQGDGDRHLNRRIGWDRLSRNDLEKAGDNKRLAAANEHGADRLCCNLQAQTVVVAENHLALNFYRGAYRQADSPSSSRPLNALGGPNADPTSARLFRLKANKR